MKRFIVVSAAISLVFVLLSAVTGILVAPGVFYTMGGGFIGVNLSETAIKYLAMVFVSYFLCALAACYFSNYKACKNAT